RHGWLVADVPRLSEYALGQVGGKIDGEALEPARRWILVSDAQNVRLHTYVECAALLNLGHIGIRRKFRHLLCRNLTSGHQRCRDDTPPDQFHRELIPPRRLFGARCSANLLVVGLVEWWQGRFRRL